MKPDGLMGFSRPNDLKNQIIYADISCGFLNHISLMNRQIGIVLTLIGAVMLVLSVFTYTKKEKIIDAGPLQISVNKKQSTDWLPYSGGILFIGGIILLATSRKIK
jgi:hypothetical protein